MLRHSLTSLKSSGKTFVTALSDISTDYGDVIESNLGESVYEQQLGEDEDERPPTPPYTPEHEPPRPSAPRKPTPSIASTTSESCSITSVSDFFALPESIFHRRKLYQFHFALSNRVFKVTRVSHGDKMAVAVKVLAKGQIAVERVLREKRVLDEMAQHKLPFVSQMFEAFQDTYSVYFVVPLGCQSLDDMLESTQGRIPGGTIRRLVSELVVGMEGLHSLGWYHHGISLESVMLSASGRVHLTSFGQARKGFVDQCGLRESDPLSVFGSSAPELAKEKDKQKGMIRYYAEKVDVWGLGLVMYGLCTCPVRMTFPPMERQYGVMRRAMARMERDEVDLLFGKLLVADPTQRATLAQVKLHPYFRGVDWEKVRRKEEEVDYVPSIPLGRSLETAPVLVEKADLSVDAVLVNEGIEFVEAPAARE